ncbi:uncharacterized protein LOC143886889 [Tasmannia lanceolata]|uniref:uncharacterized protein LOC143886889 n=1 Tax=Tasmannia lanceolata TaxID=3420 RepID=UPI00406426CF
MDRRRSVRGRRLQVGGNHVDQSTPANPTLDQVARGDQVDQSTKAKPTPDQVAECQPQTPGEEVGSLAASAASTRRGRGPTVAASTWGRREPYHDLGFNEFCQAVTIRGKDFCTFVGTLAKRGDIVPIFTKDWRRISNESKDLIFSLCQTSGQEKFTRDASRKLYVLSKVNECWRKRKNKLKMAALAVGDTPATQEVARPDYISSEDWQQLCHYWTTPEAQRHSEINKRNRAKNQMPTYGGSKSAARLREEKKREDGSMLDRTEMWLILHCKKGEALLSIEVARQKFEEIIKAQQSQSLSSSDACSNVRRDDPVAQVLGPDSHGRVLGLGGGVTPRTIFGPNGGPSAEETGRGSSAEEIRIRAQYEAQQAQLTAKVASQEIKLSAALSQIDMLQTTVEAMQRMFTQMHSQLGPYLSSLGVGESSQVASYRCYRFSDATTSSF